MTGGVGVGGGSGGVSLNGLFLVLQVSIQYSTMM